MIKFSKQVLKERRKSVNPSVKNKNYIAVGNDDFEKWLHKENSCADNKHTLAAQSMN